MRSNPGIFAVASQRASSFSCPESKLSVLPLWKKILNNHAAKAGERRAKRCKEKALTSLSEPPSLALFALDLPVHASLVAQLAKNLPTMWETLVQSLGWEDLLEKGMATHSSILASRIPWSV